MTEFELGILSSIQSIQCGFLDFLMPVVSFLGNSGMIWIVAAVLLVIFKRTRKAGFMVALFLILHLLIVNLGIKPIVGRLRPYEVDTSIKLLIPPLSDFSFPSGHASASFGSAMILMYYDKKRFGYASLILAIIISFSRLYLRVHYLSDVICGAIIGILISIISVLIINKTYKNVR